MPAITEEVVHLEARSLTGILSAAVKGAQNVVKKLLAKAEAPSSTASITGGSQNPVRKLSSCIGKLFCKNEQSASTSSASMPDPRPQAMPSYERIKRAYDELYSPKTLAHACQRRPTTTRLRNLEVSERIILLSTQRKHTTTQPQTS
jgi:hypothetical protein